MSRKEKLERVRKDTGLFKKFLGHAPRCRGHKEREFKEADRLIRMEIEKA
ncbi:MAG: hypothetical protein N3E48_01410 [Candidatus Bathyarchaeota archaeon]|nr:hypothetical protein [Candidatus Bathyarchaeota archaeon]